MCFFNDNRDNADNGLSATRTELGCRKKNSLPFGQRSCKSCRLFSQPWRAVIYKSNYSLDLWITRSGMIYMIYEIS